MPLCSLAHRAVGCSPKHPWKGPAAPGTPFILREREAPPEEAALPSQGTPQQENHGRGAGAALPDPCGSLPAQGVPRFYSSAIPKWEMAGKPAAFPCLQQDMNSPAAPKHTLFLGSHAAIAMISSCIQKSFF